MKTCNNQTRRTAHHEAAHAVISAHFFPEDQIESISIVPGKKTLGLVVISRGEPDVNYSSLQEVYGYMAANIITLLAGDAAAYVLEKEDGDSEKRGLTIRCGDTGKAWGNLIKFAEIGYGIPEEDSNTTEILLKLYRTTIRIVEQLWKHIIALAEKLLEARILLFKSGVSINNIPPGDRSCVGKELLNLSTWHKQEALYGI